MANCVYKLFLIAPSFQSTSSMCIWGTAFSARFPYDTGVYRNKARKQISPVDEQSINVRNVETYSASQGILSAGDSGS